MTIEQSIDVSGLKRGLKTGHRKENSGLLRSYKVIDLTKRYKATDAACPIDVRVYYPRETCYACVWISTSDAWGNGSGKAGGYGYDKPSQAIENAFVAAGVKFTRSFGGVGESAVREFLEELARALGLTDFIVVDLFA